MFISKKHLSRRTVLKGAGVTLALPFLEAMVPAGTAQARTAAAPRLRAGFFYLPNGAIQGDTALGPAGDRWTPSGSGTNFRLNAITQPLEPFKKYVSTVGNLENVACTGVGTKNPGTWLNCSDPPTTTVDQIIAARFTGETALPSLEVASETTVQQASGNGVITAITVSFRDPNTPLRPEFNPAKIFARLFGDGGTPQAVIAHLKERKSLLDLIRDQTRALQRDLGAGDKAVLESYLENVRTAELNVEKEAQTQQALEKNLAGIMVPDRPLGPSARFDEQVRLMFDLIAIAYQADLTRVASFMMAAEGTNQSYAHIGVPDSFLALSHHANDPDRINMLVKIQTWHMEMFAEFLRKMSQTPDGDGSLLDHSIFLYGSNMSNSDRYTNYPVPTVIVGGGNGRMKLGGQHIVPPARTPLANVHLTLLNKVGIEHREIIAGLEVRSRFADSTGMVSEL